MQIAPDEEKKENTAISKPDALTPDECRKWLSRAKVANKWWTDQLLPKYNQAKKRYNAETGYNVKKKGIASLANNTDINFLYKDLRDFIGSIFFRNPEIDLTAREDNDDEAVRRIENLQQKVNDDIKDDEELKGLLRSTLIDEGLAAVGAIYQDYYYNDQDFYQDGMPVPIPGMTNPDGTPKIKRDILKNRVEYTKILPENLIIPPWIKQYNYKSGPYLGYVDIVPLETLKADKTLNADVVAKLKGAEYKQLIDREMNASQDKTVSDDDVKHVKVFCVVIRGVDKRPMKKLMIADEEDTADTPLYYQDFDKGHKGFPIHLLMLNDAAEGFLPPSEAWILEFILQILDYVFDKMNRHLKKCGTRTYVKEGQDGLKREHIQKIIRNLDMEVIGVSGLNPGVDIRGLIHQVVDQSLGADHASMFELAKRIFDELSRKPAFSQASILNQKKTATESDKIAQVDNTENGDYVDKFKDFMKALFGDHARLTQRNFQGVVNLTIENKDTGEKDFRPDVTKDEMQGDFNADIDVNSFMPPNPEVKRRTVIQTIAEMQTLEPILKQQGQMLNGKKLIREYANNVDMRNPQDITVPIPIRNIDRQVTDLVHKQVPLNPEEIGADLEGALQRLMEIFSDEQLMADYEMKSPGISGAESPLIPVLKYLEQAVQSTNGKPGQAPKKPSGATSDVRMGAGMMAGAARA